MYIITTADPVFSGDIQIMTTTGTATNAGRPSVTLPETGTAYFIGLISDASFTDAQVRFDAGADGAFLYNVDDITSSASAVPEPSTTGFCLVALALVIGASRLQGRPTRSNLLLAISSLAVTSGYGQTRLSLTDLDQRITALEQKPTPLQIALLKWP